MNNKTMLNTVKRVLSDLNFEQVNSIYESDDAMAVARIVLNVHSAILTEYPWVIKDTIVKPLRIDLTTISVPGSVQRIRKVKYVRSRKCSNKVEYVESPRDDPFGGLSGGCDKDCNRVQSTSCHSVPYEYFKSDPYGSKSDDDADCTELTYLEMDDFLKACYVDDECKEDCQKPDEIKFVVDGDSFRLDIYESEDIPEAPVEYQIKINNNKDPQFWTVINGDIVLDSYCFRDGTRIQERRLQLIGQSVNELSLDNDQVIDLPLEFYNYMLAEILSTANYNLIGVANEKEESRSQRLRRRLLREHGLQNKKRTTIDSSGSYWRK